MSLRLQAEKDLSFTLEDSVTGFGWSLTLTNPQGTAYPLIGKCNDISQDIDPNTGALVTSRLVNVALRMSSLPAGNLPYGVSENSQRPWLVTFNDIRGTAGTYKVIHSRPDRTLGVLLLVLEKYVVTS